MGSRSYQSRRRRRLVGVLLVSLALVAAGCGDDDSSGGSGGGSDPGPFRAATFNAGLAVGFVDEAEERVPVIADELSQLDAEVVVVQEVWEPEHVTMVEEATTERYPNQIFLEPRPDENPGPPSCTVPGLDPIKQCAEERCGDLPADELANCVLAECADEFGALDGGCQSCLGANIGLPLDEILGNCTSESARFAYGGTFGIGLLTDQEIVQEDTLLLESELNRRAVIYAELDTDQISTVHVFATHLSPIFTDVPHPGGRTWEEEQADQIDAMLAFIDEKVDDGDPVLVMGDLNTGPAGANYTEEAVENYDALVAGGPFDSPYAEDPAALCTFCEANALIGGEGDGGLLIDHILVRDFDGTVEVERILDEEVEVDVDGETVMLPPSDHYGLLALLTPTGS